MIKILLWDLDGTILDFKKAEYAALKALFLEFGFGEISDEDINRYSVLNEGFWERLERCEISKRDVLVGRFEAFFKLMGIDPKYAEEFNDRYQLALGDTIIYRDDSLNILKSLKGKVPQFLVTNGTMKAQEKKVFRSGIGEVLDGIFVSEKMGADKPNVGFFDAVFKEIGPGNKDEILIIGDSLSSDILGGMNAGIKTCWYNPYKLGRKSHYRVDFEINDLHEIYGILGFKEKEEADA